MKRISTYLIVLFCFAITSQLFAQVDTALTGGNWNDPLIWSNGIPTENTDVVIIGGPALTNTVTIPASYTAKCRNLQVNGSTGTRVLTEANARLEIYGTIGSDTVGHSLLIIDNTKGANSYTVFKRQTTGPLYGAKWDGARPAYIRVIIDVPQNVTVWADTTFKSLRLTVTSGIFDLKNHDIRLDSANSNSLKGHLYVSANTTVKNVRAIYKYGSLSTQCSTITVAGTLEIDSTIATSVFRLVGKGTIRTKAVSPFTANPAVFDASSATTTGSVFEYARSGNQNVFGGASGVAYNGLMLSGSGQKIIGGTTPITVNDSLIYSGTAIHSGTINRGSSMWLVYSGTSPITTSSELLSTTKKLKIRNTGGVTLDKSLGAISDLWGQIGTLSTASFSVSLSSGANLTRTKGTFIGNFTIPSDITLIYNNTDSIITTNEMPSSVQNLKLQSSSVVRLANNCTVTGICSLQSGRLQPGAKTLTFSNTSSLVVTNGWIDGAMTSNISAVGTKLFPIGTMSAANPVAINFSSINTSGSVTAQIKSSPHPNTQYGDSTLKHYWTFTKGSGFTTFSATMNFIYPDEDIFSGGDENTYVVGKYDAPYWQFPSITGSNPASNSITIADVTSFSDFVIGKNIPAFIGYPSAKIKGLKFNDLNANGIYELGESGLSGWTIIATGLISNDTTATDELGEYTLDNLYGGTYTVKEQLVAPWIQSYPTTGTHTVSVVQDSIVTNINFGNHRNGKIGGLKFNDLNGDEVKDIAEPGISNWKIKLDGATHNNIPVNDSAFTDNDGNYIFPDVPIGNYAVSEEYYPGWLQTYPGGTGIYNLALQSNANLNNINFGNFLLGTISGHNFEDINGNRNLDVGEPGVSNWKIHLNGTTTTNTVVTESTMTDENGNYQFTNLHGGTYTTNEASTDGWTQTFPPNINYTDAITSGSVLSNRNFGNFKDGIISGIVYNDLNGNGIKDASDIGIANWHMRISGTASDTVTTDENGNYIFSGLQVGNYSVAKINQSGWAQTFPLETGYDVQILSSSVAANKNFGVFKLGIISGIAFEDINGDGIKDNGEPGIINRIVDLNTDFNQTITNENGEYEFTDLPADQYIVSVEPANGWKQTMPKDFYNVNVKSGTAATSSHFGFFKLGSIAGFIFNDVNGNGIKDGGESGLQDWKLRLSGAVSDSQLSDANGGYQFPNLAGGTFIVSEDLQDGWFETTPSTTTYSVTMRSQLDTTNLKFGNYVLGKVSGFIFNDVNSNNSYDAGEGGIADWKLKITGTMADSILTNANGFYTIEKLRIGTYTISQVVQSGWIKTYPATQDTYQVAIVAGSNFSGKEYGNFKLGIIRGNVFDDINANGTKDENEPGLANWSVKLTSESTQTKVTDANGNYSFTGLVFGDYTVNEIVQAGWIQSYPASGSYSVSVESGTNANNSDFGNYRLGSIAGTKFEDVNGNAVKDNGEPVLAGWRIYLNGTKTDSALTDASGNYLFGNLPIGQYTVTEKLQSGWVQSLPQSGSYVVNVTSGLNLTAKNFGNYRFASLSGIVWNDFNGNSVKDAGESNLSNWKVKISGLKNDSVNSDVNGTYTFSSLFVGTYTVMEVVQTNWMQTFPSEPHLVTLISGENRSDVNFGNFKLGILAGLLFNDNDNDGEKDANEIGLANWKIKMTGPRNDSAITDANGRYAFSGLIAGTYSLSETQQLGWVQTYPDFNGGVNVSTVNSGTNDSTLLFGNHLLSSIHGTAYNDLTGNGTKDAGDPPLPDWKIKLNGTSTDSILTDANGNYSFYYLITGLYSVTEVIQSGWTATEPVNGTYSVNVFKDGLIITNKNFGNFRFGSISGNVFNDFNSNGVKDEGDVTLTGWRIRLSGPKNDSLFTDANGLFQFNNLPAGTYTLSEVAQSGWLQSAPSAPGTFTITIVSNSVIENKNFGNYQLGQITGIVFDDYDADGVKDIGEATTSNWKIYISGTKSDSVLSDGNGVFSFINLVPGNYTIQQEHRNGYTQTLPVAQNYSLVLSSGSVLSANDFGNFKHGIISGAKFNDVNGNGVREAGESGIPSWKIYITGNRNDSILTNGDGNYEFTDLMNGSYTLREEMKNGWIQSAPANPGTHTVNVFSGTNESNISFGNYQLGTISGYIFNDLNDNKTKDLGEPGLSQWRIRLSVSSLDSTLSDNNGFYQFQNLNLGTYEVREVVPSSWTQTSPLNGFYLVKINSGTNASNKNFGNITKGIISGTAFEDVNGNAVKDPGEPLLSGWKINLSGTKNDSVFTNASGYYEFAELEIGNYIVSEVVQDGWIQTLPVSGSYTIPIQSGSTVINKNFGTYRVGSISGTFFNDIDGDGSRDNGEGILSNWKVFLQGTKNDSVITDGSGNYTFGNLAIGAYIVSERVEIDWKQTLPSTGTYLVSIQSNTIITGKNFANYELGKISGIAFDDVNGNGAKDAGEPLRVSWQIKIGGGKIDSSYTNDTGYYSFRGLPVGNYTLTQFLTNNYLQTLPFQHAYNVSVQGSTNLLNKDFGSFAYGLISGIKFNDINGNGVQEFNEPVIQNWKITLSGAAADTEITNNDGYYQFTNVHPGEYSVAEIQQSGWRQTVPANNQPYNLVITSGTQFNDKNFGNYQLASISGNKFDDINGNGLREENEPVISGWKIKLTGISSSDSVLTNNNGEYLFRNVEQGTYTISEFLPSGWIQTFPSSPSTYTVVINKGSQFITGKDFGNFKLGIITGIKFNDMNANGSKDTNDTGMSGWKIRLSGQMNDSMFTVANGSYSFTNLRAGTYSVNEIMQNGWYQSMPAGGSYTIVVTSGTNAANSDFGNYQNGSIAGMKFYDINGNGIKDAGENGLGNWKIRMNGYQTDSTTTDGTGNFIFANLHPGMYSLTEQQKTDWVQTYPSQSNNYTHEIDLRSGEILTNKNFGNSKSSFASGKVFNDLNNNAVLDIGEPGVSLWKIFITGPRNDSALTNTEGLFTINNLSPGTYTLSQTLKAGWVQTFPPFPGTHTLNFNDGSDTSGIIFGNLQLARAAGNVFEDKDGDELRDPNEFGLMMRSIKLTGARNETVQTDSLGNYQFTNLTIGTYYISVLPDTQWTQTIPQNRYTIVVTASGQNEAGKNFGLFRYATIAGTVFNDINGNGNQEPNESGIVGWKLYFQNAVQYDSMTTNADGYYLFNKVKWGTATLRAEKRNNYLQTYPDSGFPHTIPNITSGFSGDGFDFGEKPISSVLEQGNAPLRFDLTQNYPNPFNPSTTIKFSVDVSAVTTLRIFNILGEEVAILFNGIAEPGKYYLATFDATHFSSGMYIYRLDNGKKTETKRMLLMK